MDDITDDHPVRWAQPASPGGQARGVEPGAIVKELYCYHNDDSGESWVSLEDLAAYSLLTQDEVIGMLQGLERKAVLQMIPDDAALRRRVAPCSTIARARDVLRGTGT